MEDVYENCPSFENDQYLIRFSTLDDAKDLSRVYGDKQALPFFNSDNCHGDNFYYPSETETRQAIAFWLRSYADKWFVRWTIVDKRINQAIGSIELFKRVAADAFNDVGVLRLDLRSDYERSDIITEMIALIVPSAFKLFHCNEIITKVPIYAVERISAVQRIGFEKSDKLLIGTLDGYAYKDYWEMSL